MVSYDLEVIAVTSKANEVAAAFAAHSGFVFTLLLIIVTIGISIRYGVKNGLIIYLISLFTAMIAVAIGAISSSTLVLMILPLLIMIVFLVIFNATGGD